MIDIPEEDYNNIEPFLNGETIKGGFNLFKALEIIKNGNPLPTVIEALEQESNKWIPVSERLPEDNELVLFSTKTDRVFEGRFFSDNTNRQWYSFCDRTFAWNNVVLAWMPLPKPYKAESEVDNAK